MATNFLSLLLFIFTILATNDSYALSSTVKNKIKEKCNFELDTTSPILTELIADASGLTVDQVNQKYYEAADLIFEQCEVNNNIRLRIVLDYRLSYGFYRRSFSHELSTTPQLSLKTIKVNPFRYSKALEYIYDDLIPNIDRAIRITDSVNELIDINMFITNYSIYDYLDTLEKIKSSHEDFVASRIKTSDYDLSSKLSRYRIMITIRSTFKPSIRYDDDSTIWVEITKGDGLFDYIHDQIVPLY